MIFLKFLYFIGTVIVYDVDILIVFCCNLNKAPFHSFLKDFKAKFVSAKIFIALSIPLFPHASDHFENLCIRISFKNPNYRKHLKYVLNRYVLKYIQ